MDVRVTARLVANDAAAAVDIEPLAFADAIPACDRLVHVCPFPAGEVAVNRRQPRVGHRKVGIELNSPAVEGNGRAIAERARVSSATLNALSASSDDVVACVIGTSNFSIVASDSPSLRRSRDAESPSVFNTCSRSGASACSLATDAPDWQLIASRPMAKCVPIG